MRQKKEKKKEKEKEEAKQRQLRAKRQLLHKTKSGSRGVSSASQQTERDRRKEK